MSAKVIDGKAIAAVMRGELEEQIEDFAAKYRIRPRLEVILAGDNPASEIYVRNKQEACDKVGILSHVKRISEVTGQNLLAAITSANESSHIHGVLVQLPIPVVDCSKVFDAISVHKDVDVLNPTNVGLLMQGRPRFQPCTPLGIQHMLSRSGLSVKGKHVVIINRSNIVGKPLASMLVQDNEFANATVTVCHDNTPHDRLIEISRAADFIIVAVGIPGFLKAEAVKEGAVVIDVGITRVNDKIVGDVDSSVWDVASHVSKVPGGCGPLTITCLLMNVLTAARMLVAG